jgi:hypothetical protein
MILARYLWDTHWILQEKLRNKIQAQTLCSMKPLAVGLPELISYLAPPHVGPCSDKACRLGLCPTHKNPLMFCLC